MAASCLLLELAKYHDSDVSSDSDVVLLSQSWAPTICLQWLLDGDNHTCSTDGVGAWVMHGIWRPSQVVGKTIYCNDSWTLDIEQIKPIEPQLNRHWTIIKAPAGYEFWSHEWIKHGTCVASSKHFNSQKKYFTQAVKLMAEYSLTDVLNEAGLLPSNYAGYKVEDFFKAILFKFKVRVKVTCVQIGSKQLLREVHICFDSQLQLTDCSEFTNDNLKEWQYDKGLSVNTDCDLGTEILYIRKADKRCLF